MTMLTTVLKRHAPTWSKEVARSGFRRYGMLTSARRPLPDYLIIGTKRGGTTSLWRNLMQHPEVLPMFPAAENLKSPHYFDIHWDRGETWYRSYFPTERARSSRAREGARGAVVGEASPYYMFHPLAAERVSRAIPHVRLIVLLRNPTDRAYSHYRERRHEGTEPLDFRAALDAETERLAGEAAKIVSRPEYYSRHHDFSSYLARGRYLEHLSPWLDLFSRSQLLILRSEDLYTDPHAVLAEVHRFLGLSEQPSGSGFEHMNYLPRPGMDPATRAWLDDYYRPHVAALEARLERSFGWPLTA